MVAFGGLGVEEAMPGGTRAFTVARWIALIWVLTWFPLYTWFWGWKNMMHLCDVSVVIACLGLWFRQSLLVSSQALLAPLVGVVWSLDVLWRIVTGHHLIGGTEYMWDTHYALWLRLLSCFHIGLPVALEGALKLKELSYIPTDAYSAGEMKHGPIALLEEGTPVVVVATNIHVYDKIVSNIQETRARGAHVIAIATDGNEDIQHHADDVIYVPRTPNFLQASLAVIPLQLLAYRIARLRGLNVDQPRNLAKTVTVE